jgi:predicted RNase H-like HicB family nuclease
VASAFGASMFEQERFWLDEETQRWNAWDATWKVATSGKTEVEARQNLKDVREMHIKHLDVQ